MKPMLAIFGTLFVALAGWTAAQTGTSGRTNDLCTVTTRVTPVRDLSEGSGVTLSRRTAELLWAHNDSGQPVLVALDRAGAIKGQVQVAGAQVDDWEDVSAGPCPQGSCLYIADIGDNNRVRRQITVYRIPEPRADERTTQPAESFQAVYPDGAHDAEALFVTGANDIFIVTKAGAGATAVYKFPTPLRTGSPVRLQAVTKLPLAGVTDADASPDGAWIVLRTNEDLFFYPARDLMSGSAGQPRRFSVRFLGEPQGEGVTIGADGAVYLVGEGRSGTLAALRCNLR